MFFFKLTWCSCHYLWCRCHSMGQNVFVLDRKKYYRLQKLATHVNPSASQNSPCVVANHVGPVVNIDIGPQTLLIKEKDTIMSTSNENLAFLLNILIYFLPLNSPCGESVRLNRLVVLTLSAEAVGERLTQFSSSVALNSEQCC